VISPAASRRGTRGASATRTTIRAAELRYEQTLIVSADTTFRPDDPEPETRDVLSVDTFLRVLNVALAAYEKAYGVES